MTLRNYPKIFCPNPNCHSVILNTVDRQTRINTTVRIVSDEEIRTGAVDGKFLYVCPKCKTVVTFKEDINHPVKEKSLVAETA